MNIKNKVSSFNLSKKNYWYCVFVQLTLAIFMIIFTNHYAIVWQQILNGFGLEQVLTLTNSHEPLHKIQHTFTLYEYVTQYFSAHTLRLMIMLPVIRGAQLLHISYDLVFTGYVLGLFLLSWYFLMQTFRLYTRSQNHLIELLLFSLCIVLMLMINGRMAWVFFAVSCLLYARKMSVTNTKWCYALILILLSLLASAVSTGTFMVCYLMGLSLLFKREITTNFSIGCGILLLLFLPYAYIACVKNIIYYGGDMYSLIRMLAHGAGRYLNIYTILCLVLSVFIFLRYRNRLLPDCADGFLLGVAVFGSLLTVYGFSIFMTAIPAFMLIAALYVDCALVSTESNNLERYQL